jgi:protein-S-isoprenylcysteine O-methyltransferase Ste14
MAETPGATHASLKRRVLRVTLVFLLVQAIPIFVAAGTLRYGQGWVYMGLQAASMIATNAYLLKTDPALLERRLAVAETERVQRWVMALLRLFSLGMLVCAGLDRRFGWSAVPPAAVAAACLVFAAGVALVVRVFHENTYASTVIEVGSEQGVVTTGPYRFVRHPMYAGVLVMALAAPPILGSIVAEVFVLASFVVIVVRILAEERLLSEKLRGYAEYMNETPSRLIPGIW